MATRRADGDAGFTLIEVLVALLLIAAIAASVAEMFVVAANASRRARGHTAEALLAVQKIEQLRALVWSDEPDAAGQPRTDTTTDLSVDPPGAGGLGLRPSPAGTLTRNVDGYVDYLDGSGRWLGTGAVPPAGAVYVRRWSLEAQPSGQESGMLFSVWVASTARPSEAEQLTALLIRRKN